jgi:hypothetical protein
MRLAEPPQLTRPDGLVVCRYGLLDDTPPPPCERLSMEQRPPLPQPLDCCLQLVYSAASCFPLRRRCVFSWMYNVPAA